MDPLYEQRLRDEVIYLHSLWHQGPPRANPAPSNRLQPMRTTEFKKVNKRRGQKGKKAENKPDMPSPDSNLNSGPEWPCPSPPPPRASWGSFVAQPDPEPRSLSPEEQSRLAARNAQLQAMKVVHEFFKSNDTDESDGIDSSSDEDDELMEEDDGREEYSFFCRVFMEDADLREHYEKNFVDGDFNCLVCSAVGGRKMGRRYKGCLALIQHSITIAKTKRRRAHRAFGQAVCKVLGWDIDQLPSIVSLLSDKSGVEQECVDSGNRESSVTIINNVSPVLNNTDKVGQGSESVSNRILANGGDEAMNSLTCPDGQSNVEDISTQCPPDVEEPAVDGVLTDCTLGFFSQNSRSYPDGESNVEDIGTLCPPNVEEPAADGVMIDPSTCTTGDKNIEDPSVLCPHTVDKPAAEGLISDSTSPDFDNLEDLGILRPINVLEPAAMGLMIERVNENSSLVNEVEYSEVDKSVLNVSTEDNEAEK